MSFNVTGLADFTKGNGEVIIEDFIKAGNSFDPALGFTVIDNIKSSLTFPDIIGSDVTLQGGDPSDSTAQGTAVMDDITVAVKQLTVHERYSQFALDASVAQMAKKQGSLPDDDAYLAYINTLKGAAINARNEKLIWQGDVLSTDDNLNKFDGVITQLLASTTVNFTGSAGIKLTKTNAITQVEAFVDAFDEAMPNLDGAKVRIMMSAPNFKVYRRAVYKQDGEIDANTLDSTGAVVELRVPGTEYFVSPLHSSVVTNNIIGFRPQLVCIGSDVEDEASKIDFEYLTEAMKWRLLCLYKLGVTVARHDECLITKVDPEA